MGPSSAVPPAYHPSVVLRTRHAGRHLADPVLQARLLAGILVAYALYVTIALLVGMAPGTTREWAIVAAVAGVAVAGLLLSVPWRHLPRAALTACAPLVLVMIAAAETLAPGQTHDSAFLVALFVWIGLTQRRGAALAVAPLVVVAHAVPILINGADDRPVTPAVVLLAVALAALGELLSWLTHGARLRVEALLTSNTRYARELAASSRIAEIFATVGDDEMYADVLDTVLEQTESPLGVFAYIDENGQIVCPSLTRRVWNECMVPDKTIRFEVDPHGGIEDRTVLSGHSQISNRPSRRTPAGHLPIERVMTVPMIQRDEVIGYFMVANRPYDYDDLDRLFLEGIAAHVAPVLAARLQRYGEERARRAAEYDSLVLMRRFEALYDYLVELGHCRTMRDLARVATEGAKQATGAVSTALWLDPILSGAGVRSWAGEALDWEAVRSTASMQDDVVGLFDGRLLTDSVLEATVDADTLGVPVNPRHVRFAPVDFDGHRLAVLALAFVPSDRIDRHAVEMCANELGVVIDRIRRYEDARYWAERDPLTAVLNHRTVHERLQQTLDRAERTGDPLSVLVVDLDHLKTFNDAHGHVAGDTVIKATAACIAESLREVDSLGRIGGDEFLAVLVEAGADEASLVARRILQRLSERRFRPSDGADIPLSASIGIAVYPEDGGSVDHLFMRADQMLYLAKADGGMAVARDDEIVARVEPRARPNGGRGAVERRADRAT